MKKVIWGVLSTAKIGRERVLPGMKKSRLLEIRAIASRDEARARQTAPHQRLRLCGTKGRIELHVPVNAPQGARTRLSIDDCSSLEGTGVVTETLPESDPYQLQGEAFSRALRGEIVLPYGVEDAIANMRAIDALFRSERSGSWETVSLA